MKSKKGKTMLKKQTYQEKENLPKDTCEDSNCLDCLEEELNKVTKRIKKLAKKNGFSKQLKQKTEVEL